MGSSESAGPGLADSGAGSIVWVRRRNGSWWPGKILGPDELSASHLMSPRSGTPVKLLGREDASVDWYNLEKSKRVKAFRCGEFDDCIERAEASLGLPAKKREKYARREDAILHALELEKQFLEKKYGKLGITSCARENSTDSERKDLATSSRALENGNGKLGNHELYQLDLKVDVSSMMERNTLHARKAKDGIHATLEEQNLEAGHRIRALHDFGLRTVPVNRIYTSAASDDSNRMPVDTRACGDAANDPCFDNSGDSDSRSGTRKGKKRLLEGFVKESFPKRHHRYHADSPGCSLQPDADHVSLYGKKKGHGVCDSMYFAVESAETFDTNHVPYMQMDMPVSQLDVGIVHAQHDNSAEESTSGSSEETESDSSETHSLEPHVDVGMMLSDADTSMRAQSRTLDRLQREGGGHESTSSDESDELSLDERSQFYIHDSNASGIGVSKWQLKGKRNVRNFGRRPIDRFAHRMYLEGRGRSLSERASNSLNYCHETDYNNDVDFIDDDFDPHSQGISKRGYFPLQVAANRPTFVGRNMIDWEELTWGRPFRGYWEERGSCFNPMFVGRNGHDMLIDVDLKVQANRQGEHVPWVSLMSRLNGKAIIGHPIQIEALEDGSTDMLVSTSDAYDDSIYGVERNRVSPVWKTARRTANFRVPRPHLSTQQDDCNVDAENQYFHQCGKVRSKKSHASNSFRKGGSMKRTNAHVQGLKKPPRKSNQSSNQKTKPLSSIGFDQKSGNRKGGRDTSYYVDGVIKLVDSGPPAVACIPVKLVFSRLLEAVGRPPSGLGKHRSSSEQQQKDRNPS